MEKTRKAEKDIETIKHQEQERIINEKYLPKDKLAPSNPQLPIVTISGIQACRDKLVKAMSNHPQMFKIGALKSTIHRLKREQGIEYTNFPNGSQNQLKPGNLNDMIMNNEEVEKRENMNRTIKVMFCVSIVHKELDGNS